MTTHRRIFAVLFVLLLLPAPARASDWLIEGARQCTQYFPVKEREYGIPVHLLAAISSIETGRYHKGLEMPLPWPWTINVEGKGYYFNSKAEVIEATRRHLAAGKRSIDVGCMQVNLVHHAKAFANLEEAFDPAMNVDYAARFLRTNYKDLNHSWVKAAAAYHSRTPSRGNPYLQKVAKAWKHIVTKVQQAQARMGVTPTTQPAESLAQAEARSPVAVPTQNATRPIREAQRVKVIQVSEAAAAQRAPVMVVTPASYTRSDPVSAPVHVADEVPAVRSITPRRVVVEDPGAAAGQPNFVFAN